MASTTVRDRPDTAEGVLAAVTALAPSIAARAAEVERARRLPPDLLDELVATGAFATLLPRSHGGIGGDLPSSLRVVEQLARADGSVGWTVMIGSCTWFDLVGLPRATFDALFADGPDVMIAGVFSPSGVAVPVDGGFRVSGRWPFASGSPHAQWFYGNCVEEGAGPPTLRIALFPREAVVVEDTWHVAGLAGTGSHHFHVDNVVVPSERTWAVLAHDPQLDDPVVRVPPPALFALHVAAAALGIAQGAVDDITEIAVAKVPLLAPGALATSPSFHTQLATATTALRAARTLVESAAQETWDTAMGGDDFTLERRARIRAAAAWSVAVAADVVTTAYRAGGGSAVYLDSPLQRRLRDISAVTQHFLVRHDTLTTAGAVFAGQDIDTPVF